MTALTNRLSHFLIALPEELLSERQLPAVPVRIKDIDGVVVAISVGPHFFDIGADFLQCSMSLVFFLPRDVERVMGIHRARPFRSVEQMNLKVSQAHINFLD